MLGASHPSSATSLPCCDSKLTLHRARLSAQRDADGEDAHTAITPKAKLSQFIGTLMT